MFNGFKNKETWIVNLYLQNTEHWYNYYGTLSSILNEKELAETIRLDMNYLIPEDISLILRELLTDSFNEVDWLTIAHNFCE